MELCRDWKANADEHKRKIKKLLIAQNLKKHVRNCYKWIQKAGKALKKQPLQAIYLELQLPTLRSWKSLNALQKCIQAAIKSFTENVVTWNFYK